MATLEPYGVPVSVTNERRKLAKALAKKHRRTPLRLTKQEALEAAKHIVSGMSDEDVAFLLRRYSTPKE